VIFIRLCQIPFICGFMQELPCYWWWLKYPTSLFTCVNCDSSSTEDCWGAFITIGTRITWTQRIASGNSAMGI